MLSILPLGLVGWVIPVFNKAGSRAAFDLELEFEVPAESLKDYKDRDHCKWGYAGETKDEKADSPFYDHTSEENISHWRPPFRCPTIPRAVSPFSHITARYKAFRFR